MTYPLYRSCDLAVSRLITSAFMPMVSVPPVLTFCAGAAVAAAAVVCGAAVDAAALVALALAAAAGDFAAAADAAPEAAGACDGALAPPLLLLLPQATSATLRPATAAVRRSLSLIRSLPPESISIHLSPADGSQLALSLQSASSVYHTRHNVG